LKLENATLSGNESNTHAGAIYNDNSTVDSVNNTIAYNWAPNVDGILAVAPGEARVRNSILIFSGLAAWGAVASDGANVLNKSSPLFAAPTDLVATDPLIEPLVELAPNIWVHPLGRDSPAIDLAEADGAPGGGPSNLYAPPTDARGVARPQGFGVDAGAYEFDGAPKDLRLLAPNESRAYGPGELVTVRWVAHVPVAGTAIDVELWLAGAHVADLGEASHPDGRGAATFPLPPVPYGTAYRLRIRSAFNPEIFDDSHALFTVRALNALPPALWPRYR
jgi:hypothetical protein